MAENKNVRFVLEMVIQDYMGVLRDSVNEEDGITEDQWYEFVDGIFEIGKAFDINVCDLDQGELVPVLLTREQEAEIIRRLKKED